MWIENQVLLKLAILDLLLQNLNSEYSVTLSV